MSNIVTFADLLSWLAGAGAVILVSWFSSWALEGWSAWDNLPSRAKSSMILVVSLLIGLVAVALRGLPPETMKMIEPYIQAVLVVIGAWLATQTAHRLDSKSK